MPKTTTTFDDAWMAAKELKDSLRELVAESVDLPLWPAARAISAEADQMLRRIDELEEMAERTA